MAITFQAYNGQKLPQNVNVTLTSAAQTITAATDASGSIYVTLLLNVAYVATFSGPYSPANIYATSPPYTPSAIPGGPLLTETGFDIDTESGIPILVEGVPQAYFGNPAFSSSVNTLLVLVSLGPALQTILPCYPYQQYSDDPNIYAFFNAVNELAQPYLDYFNQTPFAVYTNASINGPLLDWIGQGIYGISRPVFSTEATQVYGGVNVFAVNTIAVNGDKVTQVGNAVVANDDFYKRVLTWNLYAGNGGNGGEVGRYFNVEVLRLKVARFLYGTNGTDVTLTQAQAVSIQPQPLPAPTQPPLHAVARGTLPARTYGVQATYVTSLGESLPSPAASIALTANQIFSTDEFLLGAQTGAIGYNVYANILPTFGATYKAGVNSAPVDTLPINGNNRIAVSPPTKQNASPIPLGTIWYEPTTGLVVGSPLPTSNTSNTPGNFIISVPASTAATYLQQAFEDNILAFPFLFSATVVT